MVVVLLKMSKPGFDDSIDLLVTEVTTTLKIRVKYIILKETL